MRGLDDIFLQKSSSFIIIIYLFFCKVKTGATVGSDLFWGMWRKSVFTQESVFKCPFLALALFRVERERGFEWLESLVNELTLLWQWRPGVLGPTRQASSTDTGSFLFSPPPLPPIPSIFLLSVFFILEIIGFRTASLAVYFACVWFLWVRGDPEIKLILNGL